MLAISVLLFALAGCGLGISMIGMIFDFEEAENIGMKISVVFAAIGMFVFVIALFLPSSYHH